MVWWQRRHDVPHGGAAKDVEQLIQPTREIHIIAIAGGASGLFGEIQNIGFRDVLAKRVSRVTFPRAALRMVIRRDGEVIVWIVVGTTTVAAPG